MSPTQRSLKELKKRGYDLIQVVEHWNAFAKIRQDLFGIIDILIVSGGETIAVQTTSWDNVSARTKKMLESPAYPHIKEAGWTLLVHGWAKKGPRGGKKEWTLREEIV